MDIKNIIASFTGSSKVNSNKSYTSKDSQSFLKILEQSSERTNFQKKFDNNIELLQDKFSLDKTSVDNIKNLVKSIESNASSEVESLYKGLSSGKLSEPSLKEIVSGLETLIANNMNLTSKEISNVKEKLESKINSLEDNLTIEMDSIDKLKSVLKGIDENLAGENSSNNNIKDINRNLANEILFNSKNNVNKSDDSISVKGNSNSNEELAQLLQEVKTKLNMNSSEKVSDKNLANETLYKGLPVNANSTEVKTENTSGEITSEELIKSIENMLSDKDISEPSLKDIILGLETLIANNMNLTSKEISNVKEKLESKISSLEDDLTIEMDSIDKLKSVLKGIDENLAGENSSNNNIKDINRNLANEILFNSKNNVNKSDDSISVKGSSNLNEELVQLLQEVKTKLNMNSSEKVSDKNLANETLYKGLPVNANSTEVKTENTSGEITSEELIKSIENMLSDKDISEPSLKDIILGLETLIANNMNLTSKEISNVKEKLESKINSLEDNLTIEMNSIDKLKSVLKGIDENLAGENSSNNNIKDINRNLANEILFNSKNNVNKSDDSISVKGSSNLNEELVQLLQEVKTKLNMNSSEKVSDKNLANETLYKGLPVNANSTEVKTENTSDEITSEELIKSIENMLSYKDASESSLKDIISGLETLIANNMNLTSKEISNVKEKLESKINSLEDNLTIEMNSIDKLKSVLKGIDENLAGENSSNNNIKDINTNLANEILFNSKNNVNKSDDSISVKGNSNSNEELAQLLQEVKTKLNMNSSEKVSDKNLANETLYKGLPVNANSTEVKTENTSDEITSEELIKSIENMLSDKDISETSLKDIVLGLETLIANNMNLTSKEISNVKEKLESKINSLEDNLTVEMNSIDKLKSILKGIDENLAGENSSNNNIKDINTNLANEILFNSKNNVNKSDDSISVKGNSNSNEELAQLLQEVKTKLNMNSSEKVSDKNLANETLYKGLPVNANSTEVKTESTSDEITSEELTKSIENMLSDKDISETSLKDIVLGLETLITNNMNLTSKEISNVKEKLESKINSLEDNLTIEMNSIDKLKSVLKGIDENLAGENSSNNNIKDINTTLANEILFNSKNNVNKSDDAISVKDSSNSNEELAQLLQEVKTKLNMNSSEKVSDKNLANETLYKGLPVNANSTEVKTENTSDEITSEELIKSIENMLSYKDASESSLKDIISGLETLIANNMNLTSKEISNVKEKLESKINSLEDNLTVEMNSIDKLKSILKGIDENLASENLRNNNIKDISTNLIKDINTNLANENLFNSKNNVNKSDDSISVKGSSNSNEELVQLLQEVKTKLNMDSSEKVLDNSTTNEKVSDKDSSEELVLKNLFKDSSQDNKISRAINFMTHLNSVIETTKIPSEEQVVINKDTIVKDILKSVEYMETNNLKNLTVKINPKELGEVIIKVTMESGAMKANITAQNKETFNLLNSNLAELNNKLESNNIRVEGFTIDIYEDTTFFMGQPGHESNGSNQRRKNSSSITKETKDDIEVLNNLNEELNNINMFA